MKNCTAAIVAFLAAVTTGTARAADCPLKGTWDTGFLSKFGQGENRFTMTFDCAGNTVFTAYNTRGKLIQSTAQVVERRGTYQVGAALPEAPRATAVDIQINAITLRYLDPTTVDMVHNHNLNCGDATTAILVPLDMAGKQCDGTAFPPAGSVERAAMQLSGDTLYWSPLHGANALLIQAPTDAVQRHPDLDLTLPFQRVSAETL